MTDFLEDDVPENNDAHMAEARRYVDVFVATEAGRALLADWTERLMNQRVPVNAPHTQYAATEAVRSFIAQIHAQIKVAQKRQ